MIFKKWFQPKHLHKDAQVRITSIDSLSPNTPEHKSILHELAFNDVDYHVSIAALNKLNSFVLWQKVAEKSEHSALKNLASQKVLAELTASEFSMITEQEFNTYIRETKQTKMLENLLADSEKLKQNSELVLLTLSKINKKNLVRRVFKDVSDEKVRLAIVDSCDDTNELKWFVKQSDTKKLAQLAEDKLTQQRTAELLPKQLIKSVTMNNSLLLSLKDSQDYEYVVKKSTALCKEFSILHTDFVSLPEITAQELASKHSHIRLQINAHIEKLAPAYEQASASKKVDDSLADISEHLVTINEQCAALTNNVESRDISVEKKLLINALEDLKIQLNSVAEQKVSSAQKNRIENMSLSITGYYNAINGAQASISANSDFQTLFDEVSIIELPSTVEELEQAQATLDKANKSFNTIKKQHNDAVLSPSLKNEWMQWNKQWRTSITALIDSVKQQERQCVSKLRFVQRTVEQGKFKIGLSSYQHAKQMYDALNPVVQSRVTKLFDEVTAKVTELKEWQAYLAAPRKPALLQQAIDLGDGEVVEARDRVAAVKMLRKEWQSLGVLNTDADTKLNNAFDLALERAFKPCKILFEQQDKERAEALIQKQSLLTDLETLSKQEHIEGLQKSLHQIMQKWRNIGQVDLEQRKGINDLYKKHTKSIQLRLDQSFDANKLAKTALVEKARELSQLSVEEATEEAKALQQQWKKIGFAGKASDTSLWQEFRQLNDDVFEQLKQQKSEESNQHQADLLTIQQFCVIQIEAIDKSNVLSELPDITATMSEHKAKAASLPNNLNVVATGVLNKLIEHQSKRVKELKAIQKDQYLISVFEQLAQWKIGTDITSNIHSLPNKYKAWFKKSESDYSRLELTVIIEILTESDTPQKDEALRKTVQLSLMAKKLEGSAMFDLNDLMAQWISHGPLQEGDSALLKRAKKAFLSA